MELTALVTKGITVADESIRIQIQGDDTFSDFKEKVQEACRYVDYRAHMQMRRLFEDTGLTEQLTIQERDAVEYCAYTLFPLERLAKEPILRGGVKFEFTKLFAASESVTVQVTDIDSYDSLNTTIRNVWELLDTRLQVTNKREQDFREYLSTVDYSTRLKVAMVIELLYGKVSEDVLQSRLAQQKEVESGVVDSEDHEPTLENYNAS